MALKNYGVLVEETVSSEYRNFCDELGIRKGAPIEAFMQSFVAGKVIVKDGELCLSDGEADHELMRRKIPAYTGRKVAAYSLPLGRLYKVYNSIKEAAKDLNLHEDGISRACRITHKYMNSGSGYYFFRYVDRNAEPEKRIIMLNPRYINQYSLDGKYINTFISRAEAERQLGISQITIAAVVRGDLKSAGDFLFRPYNENPELKDLVFENSKKV